MTIDQLNDTKLVDFKEVIFKLKDSEFFEESVEIASFKKYFDLFSTRSMSTRYFRELLESQIIRVNT
jgi:hypothetical protein